MASRTSGHGLRRNRRRPPASVFDNVVQTLRLLRQRCAYVPHGCEPLHHTVGNEFLAVNAADGSRAAILVDLLDDG